MTRPRAAVACIVVAATLAACSGDDDEVTGPAPGPATTTAATTARDGGTDDGEIADTGMDSAMSDCLPALTAGGIGRGGGDHDDVQEVAGAVAELRELAFADVPEPTYLPPDRLTERAAAFVDEYPPADAERDQAALVALGAIPAGTDLRQLLRRALGSQVAGFYDDDTGELVVGGDLEGGLDPVERIILAHELEHALADQALDLPVPAGQPPPGEEDAAFAAQSLVEGDATLTMTLYALRHLSLQDLGSLSEEDLGQRELSGLPDFLQRQLLFPYTEGLAFTCRLHREGGWGAVDAAYDEPPATTAQVLFPDRYVAKEPPADPRDPPSPGPAWEAGPVQSLGAADLLFLFSAPGGDDGEALWSPRERTAAWAGGELRVSTRDGAAAVAVALVERADAPVALCSSVRDWYRAAFPDGRDLLVAGEDLTSEREGQVAVLRCDGRQVRLGIGPDLATARALAA